MELSLSDQEILIPLLHQFLAARIFELETNSAKEMQDIQNMNKELTNIQFSFKNILDLERQLLLGNKSNTNNTNNINTNKSYSKKTNSTSVKRSQNKRNVNSRNTTIRESSPLKSKTQLHKWNKTPYLNTLHTKPLKEYKQQTLPLNQSSSLCNNNNSIHKCSNNNNKSQTLQKTQEDTRSKSVRHFKPKKEQKGFIKTANDYNNEYPTVKTRAKTPAANKKQIPYNKNNNDIKPLIMNSKTITPQTNIDILNSLDNKSSPYQHEYAFADDEENESTITNNSVYRKKVIHSKHKDKAVTNKRMLHPVINIEQYKAKVNKTLANNFGNITQFLSIPEQYMYTKLTKSNMKAFFTIIIQNLQLQLTPLQQEIDKLHYVSNTYIYIYINNNFRKTYQKIY